MGLPSGASAKESAYQCKRHPVCETAKETQMCRTVFWTLWERARVGWFGRMALKHVYYHMWNKSPVQVQCMRQGAQDWCTEMTLRDGMGWEVEWDGEGGGMGWGGRWEGGSGWEHMYTHGGFMSMYGKNHYNIVK